MINCFCMYSDYTPLTLEEWIECDKERRNKKTEIWKAAEAIRAKAEDIARGERDYMTYDEVFGE